MLVRMWALVLVARYPRLLRACVYQDLSPNLACAHQTLILTSRHSVGKEMTAARLPQPVVAGIQKTVLMETPADITVLLTDL